MMKNRRLRLYPEGTIAVQKEETAELLGGLFFVPVSLL